MKPKNSLLHKKYCEVCEKDISASYFSKHIQSQAHLNKVKTVSSEDEVKDLKIEKILSSESDKEEESTDQEESTEQEEPQPKQSAKKSAPKQSAKPLKYVYELSESSEDEPQPPKAVKGSNFIRFIRELDENMNINDKSKIIEIYNDVIGHQKSRLYIPSQQKNKLRRYIDKFQQENTDIDEDEVDNFMRNFLSNL